MSAAADSGWQRVVRWCAKERFSVGASVLRIVAGATILYQYLINYEQRRYLFGPNGLYPFELVGEAPSRLFSLYAWSRSPAYFELLFHLGIVAALLWTIGWRTRITTIVTGWLWASWHQRFPLIWDGGDNVMQLAFFYLAFADLGAHFSVDETRRRACPVDPEWRRLSAIAHNAAMLAIACQVSLVYGVAGLTKVQGETWRNGTALYFALRGGEFTWPGVSEHIFHNVWLLTLLAYATVFFQVSFPFLLVINRGTRLFAVAAGLSFHVGIALVMGLTTFAGFLVAMDLSLLSDDEYRWLVATARRAVGALRWRRAQWVRA